MRSPETDNGAPDDSQVRFTPLHPAGNRARALVVLAGPLLWLVALIVVSFVVREGEAVGLALVIATASFLVSLLLVVPTRIRRLRRERRS